MSRQGSPIATPRVAGEAQTPAKYFGSVEAEVRESWSKRVRRQFHARKLKEKKAGRSKFMGEKKARIRLAKAYSSRGKIRKEEMPFSELPD